MFQFEKYACSHDKLTQTHIYAQTSTLSRIYIYTHRGERERERKEERNYSHLHLKGQGEQFSTMLCLPDTPSKFSFVIKHFYLCYLRCHGLGWLNIVTLIPVSALHRHRYPYYNRLLGTNCRKMNEYVNSWQAGIQLSRHNGLPLITGMIRQECALCSQAWLLMDALYGYKHFLSSFLSFFSVSLMIVIKKVFLYKVSCSCSQQRTDLCYQNVNRNTSWNNSLEARKRSWRTFVQLISRADMNVNEREKKKRFDETTSSINRVLD